MPKSIPSTPTLNRSDQVKLHDFVKNEAKISELYKGTHDQSKPILANRIGTGIVVTFASKALKSADRLEVESQKHAKDLLTCASNTTSIFSGTRTMDLKGKMDGSGNFVVQGENKSYQLKLSECSSLGIKYTLNPTNDKIHLEFKVSELSKKISIHFLSVLCSARLSNEEQKTSDSSISVSLPKGSDFLLVVSKNKTTVEICQERLKESLVTKEGYDRCKEYLKKKGIPEDQFQEKFPFDVKEEAGMYRFTPKANIGSVDTELLSTILSTGSISAYKSAPEEAPSVVNHLKMQPYTSDMQYRYLYEIALKNDEIAQALFHMNSSELRTRNKDELLTDNISQLKQKEKSYGELFWNALGARQKEVQKLPDTPDKQAKLKELEDLSLEFDLCKTDHDKCIWLIDNSSKNDIVKSLIPNIFGMTAEEVLKEGVKERLLPLSNLEQLFSNWKAYCIENKDKCESHLRKLQELKSCDVITLLKDPKMSAKVMEMESWLFGMPVDDIKKKKDKCIERVMDMTVEKREEWYQACLIFAEKDPNIVSDKMLTDAFAKLIEVADSVEDNGSTRVLTEIENKMRTFMNYFSIPAGQIDTPIDMRRFLDSTTIKPLSPKIIINFKAYKAKLLLICQKHIAKLTREEHEESVLDRCDSAVRSKELVALFSEENFQEDNFDYNLDNLNVLVSFVNFIPEIAGELGVRHPREAMLALQGSDPKCLITQSLINGKKELFIGKTQVTRESFNKARSRLLNSNSFKSGSLQDRWREQLYHQPFPEELQNNISQIESSFEESKDTIIPLLQQNQSIDVLGKYLTNKDHFNFLISLPMMWDSFSEPTRKDLMSVVLNFILAQEDILCDNMIRKMEILNSISKNNIDTPANRAFIEEIIDQKLANEERKIDWNLLADNQLINRCIISHKLLSPNYFKVSNFQLNRSNFLILVTLMQSFGLIDQRVDVAALISKIPDLGNNVLDLSHLHESHPNQPNLFPEQISFLQSLAKPNIFYPKVAELADCINGSPEKVVEVFTKGPKYLLNLLESNWRAVKSPEVTKVSDSQIESFDRLVGNDKIKEQKTPELKTTLFNALETEDMLDQSFSAQALENCYGNELISDKPVTGETRIDELIEHLLTSGKISSGQIFQILQIRPEDRPIADQVKEIAAQAKAKWGSLSIYAKKQCLIQLSHTKDDSINALISHELGLLSSQGKLLLEVARQENIQLGFDQLMFRCINASSGVLDEFLPYYFDTMTHVTRPINIEKLYADIQKEWQSFDIKDKLDFLNALHKELIKLFPDHMPKELEILLDFEFFSLMNEDNKMSYLYQYEADREWLKQFTVRSSQITREEVCEFIYNQTGETVRPVDFQDTVEETIKNRVDLLMQLKHLLNTTAMNNAIEIYQFFHTERLEVAKLIMSTYQGNQYSRRTEVQQQIRLQQEKIYEDVSTSFKASEIDIKKDQITQVSREYRNAEQDPTKQLPIIDVSKCKTMMQLRTTCKNFITHHKINGDMKQHFVAILNDARLTQSLQLDAEGVKEKSEQLTLFQKEKDHQVAKLDGLYQRFFSFVKEIEADTFYQQFVDSKNQLMPLASLTPEHIKQIDLFIQNELSANEEFYERETIDFIHHFGRELMYLSDQYSYFEDSVFIKDGRLTDNGTKLLQQLKEAKLSDVQEKESSKPVATGVGYQKSKDYEQKLEKKKQEKQQKLNPPVKQPSPSMTPDTDSLSGLDDMNEEDPTQGLQQLLQQQQQFGNYGNDPHGGLGLGAKANPADLAQRLGSPWKG